MRRPPKSWIRILGGLVALWLLVVAWGLIFAWRTLPCFMPGERVPLRAAIMTSREYDEMIATHVRPYVVTFECGGGALLLYGAEHTKDRHDPKLEDIESQWRTFRPTVALCESRLGIMFPGLMDAVETFGEPGFVHLLARQSGIPTYSWEPPSEALIESLLQQHSNMEVATKLILGPYFSNLRHGRPADPTAFVEEFRRKRVQWKGLEQTFDSVADIDAYWMMRFPNGPYWRNVSDEFGLPGFLAEIDTNAARDEHFAQVVIERVRNEERVFAIAGVSHTVKLDAALRSTLCGQ